jgi:hypothetical protein
MPIKHPSPRRFAAAIAERLDQVIPPGLSVRAEGTSVNVYAAKTSRHASGSAETITDDDGRTLVERISTAALVILGGAQDAVMDILTEEWPLGPDGSVVYPASRVEGDNLLMWFGDEQAPVLGLPPLDLTELTDGAA